MRAPALFVLFGALIGRGRAIVGVKPDAWSKFSGEGGFFKCFSDGASVPLSAVNDEFADCEDGSDEPGTGASAGQSDRLFYCQNDGGTARNLYASRVGDGICDCCDGSDEASLASRRPDKKCPNVCAEQGKIEREAQEKIMNALRQGVAQRQTIEKQALLDQQRWQEEIVPVQTEVDALNAAHEETKKLREEAEAAEKKLKDAMAPPPPTDVPAGCMWRQTGDCKPTGARESSNDKSCTASIDSGVSGYCDCNGNGQWDEKDEVGYYCSGTPGTCAAKCSAKAALEEDVEVPAETPAADAAEGKEEAQVSEYAKWMDGAAETLGGDAKDDTATRAEAVAASAAEARNLQIAEQLRAQKAAPDDSAGATAEAAKDAETTALDAAKNVTATAKEAEKEARKKLDEKKKVVTDLQNKVKAVDTEHLGYASLIGKTISKTFGEHEYKASFFNDAKQGYTSLGTWKGFTGPKSGAFEGGASCWNGPMRKLNVKFQCDIVEELVDVYEPSRCVYEAIIKAPGACDPQELEAYGSDRVVGPKDEL